MNQSNYSWTGSPGQRRHRLRWYWRVLDNPHWYAGAIVAMLAANAASLIWAVIVLLHDDSLTRAGSHYAWIVGTVPENALACLFGSLAIVQAAWLFLRLPPIRLCHAGYGLMCLAWMFVALNLLVSRPIYPTATSLSVVVAALAWFAYWSRPKQEPNNGLAREG